jgi:hypothetical protein
VTSRSARWTHAAGVVLVTPFYIGLYLITLIGTMLSKKRN